MKIALLSLFLLFATPIVALSQPNFRYAEEFSTSTSISSSSVPSSDSCCSSGSGGGSSSSSSGSSSSGGGSSGSGGDGGCGGGGSSNEFSGSCFGDIITLTGINGVATYLNLSCPHSVGAGTRYVSCNGKTYVFKEEGFHYDAHILSSHGSGSSYYASWGLGANFDCSCVADGASNRWDCGDMPFNYFCYIADASITYFCSFTGVAVEGTPEPDACDARICSSNIDDVNKYNSASSSYCRDVGGAPSFRVVERNDHYCSEGGCDCGSSGCSSSSDNPSSSSSDEPSSSSSDNPSSSSSDEPSSSSSDEPSSSSSDEPSSSSSDEPSSSSSEEPSSSSSEKPSSSSSSSKLEPSSSSSEVELSSSSKITSSSSSKLESSSSNDYEYSSSSSNYWYGGGDESVECQTDIMSSGPYLIDNQTVYVYGNDAYNTSGQYLGDANKVVFSRIPSILAKDKTAVRDMRLYMKQQNYLRKQDSRFSGSVSFLQKTGLDGYVSAEHTYRINWKVNETSCMCNPPKTRMVKLYINMSLKTKVKEIEHKDDSLLMAHENRHKEIYESSLGNVFFIDSSSMVNFCEKDRSKWCPKIEGIVKLGFEKKLRNLINAQNKWDDMDKNNVSHERINLDEKLNEMQKNVKDSLEKNCWKRYRSN